MSIIKVVGIIAGACVSLASYTAITVAALESVPRPTLDERLDRACSTAIDPAECKLREIVRIDANQRAAIEREQDREAGN